MRGFLSDFIGIRLPGLMGVRLPCFIWALLPGFVLTFLLGFVPQLIFAQQDALFTQYMYTKLEFNPAYAGSHEGISLDLLGRFQWVGIEGAPKTLCLTAHTPLPNEHLGLGMYVYICLLYTSPSPRDRTRSRMPSSA